MTKRKGIRGYIGERETIKSRLSGEKWGL